MALAGVFLVVQPGNSFIRSDDLSSSATNEASERLKGVACGIVGVFGGVVSPTRNIVGYLCAIA